MLAVAVALRPADFAFGADCPDAAGWELFDEIYHTNPKLLLDESDFEMLRLWSLYKTGHLPDHGGSMNQPSAMLDAFAIMEAAAQEFREDYGEGGD